MNNIQNNYGDDFIISDTWHYTVFLGLVTHYRLKQNEALVMSVIASYSRKKMWCYISQKNIGVMIGVKEDAVRSALKSLEGKGLIEKKDIKFKGKTDQWRLNREVIDRLNYVLERVMRKGKKVGFD